MKNLSTRLLTLLAGAALAASAIAQPLELAPNAPDRYVVVRGDTLWDISGRFLRKPWRWPEIWRLNREEIRNPHWIYPGDVIYLDRSGATPRLRLGRHLGQGAGSESGYAPLERLEPHARSEPLAAQPIPTVDLASIAPFMNRPLAVDANDLRSHPRILAGQEGRLNLTSGDVAYVRGMGADPGRDWFVYRPARPILNPVTHEPVAWEALNVGLARLEQAGDPATVRIVTTTQEVEIGDRLMPARLEGQPTWVPHAPDRPVSGQVASVFNGLGQTGKYGVVVIDVGAAAGLEPGHVLSILRPGRLVTDDETRQRVRLPAEPVGHLLLFRVFDKIAYGLVMASSRPVEVGDDVGNP